MRVGSPQRLFRHEAAGGIVLMLASGLALALAKLAARRHLRPAAQPARLRPHRRVRHRETLAAVRRLGCILWDERSDRHRVHDEPLHRRPGLRGFRCGNPDASWRARRLRALGARRSGSAHFASARSHEGVMAVAWPTSMRPTLRANGWGLPPWRRPPRPMSSSSSRRRSTSANPSRWTGPRHLHLLGPPALFTRRRGRLRRDHTPAYHAQRRELQHAGSLRKGKPAPRGAPAQNLSA